MYVFFRNLQAVSSPTMCNLVVVRCLIPSMGYAHIKYRFIGTSCTLFNFVTFYAINSCLMVSGKTLDASSHQGKTVFNKTEQMMYTFNKQLPNGRQGNPR